VRSVKEECLSKIILFGERSYGGRYANTSSNAERKSSGEGQRPVVPSQYGHPPRGRCAMSREAGRALAVITIKKRREMAWQGKSWMSAVRLVVELRPAQ